MRNFAIGLIVCLALNPCVLVHRAYSGGSSILGELSKEGSAWLRNYSLQKADEPNVKHLLENGATGVCESWASSEDGSVRRGNPQPPHPMDDGTVLREIEIFDIDGRYVRVLWERDMRGNWIKQRYNLAYREEALRGAIQRVLSKHYGFWKIDLGATPTSFVGLLVGKIRDQAPYPAPPHEQSESWAKRIVPLVIVPIFQEMAQNKAKEEVRCRPGVNPVDSPESRELIRRRTAELIDQWAPFPSIIQ